MKDQTKEDLAQVAAYIVALIIVGAAAASLLWIITKIVLFGWTGHF